MHWVPVSWASCKSQGTENVQEKILQDWQEESLCSGKKIKGEPYGGPLPLYSK